MASALALTALIGGTGISAYSTIKEGESADEAGKMTQQKYYSEAEATRQAGQYELREMVNQAERLKSSQIANISANGGVITGSNLALIADSAYEAAMDRVVTGTNYARRVSELKQAGDIARYEGQMSKRNARMRAAADILGTAGMLYLTYKTPKVPNKTGIKGTASSRLPGYSSRNLPSYR